jgi:hypothetical protein
MLNIFSLENIGYILVESEKHGEPMNQVPEDRFGCEEG